MKKTQIIFENSEILVINKEYGVSVQGGINIFHPLDEELSKELGYKIYLVHRLDKETSGLMIVAKNPKAANKWIELIASKSVKKEYSALCFDVPKINGKPQTKGVLKDNLQKNGKNVSALTYFEVEKTFEKEVTVTNGTEEETKKLDFSLIHLTLGTGRTHQIRLHLAKALSPIVQDDKHGNFKLNKLAKKCGFKKMCLCSTKLTLPLENEVKTFEIPLPEYFMQC